MGRIERIELKNTLSFAAYPSIPNNQHQRRDVSFGKPKTRNERGDLSSFFKYQRWGPLMGRRSQPCWFDLIGQAVALLNLESRLPQPPGDADELNDGADPVFSGSACIARSSGRAGLHKNSCFICNCPEERRAAAPLVQRYVVRCQRRRKCRIPDPNNHLDVRHSR